MTNEERLRRFLLILSAVALVATIVELLLTEHTGEALQVVPFFLCGLGLVAITGVLLSRSRLMLRLLRVVMMLVALGGVAGIVLHLQGNVEFAREIEPNASTGTVIWEALHGASPLLAPGILILGATLAFAATYSFEPRRSRR